MTLSDLVLLITLLAQLQAAEPELLDEILRLVQLAGTFPQPVTATVKV
jgi:hypothetical protein